MGARSNANKTEIANRLTKLIDLLGINILAQLLGCSDRSISYYVKGERTINGTALRLLEDVERDAAPLMVRFEAAKKLEEGKKRNKSERAA